MQKKYIYVFFIIKMYESQNKVMVLSDPKIIRNYLYGVKPEYHIFCTPFLRQGNSEIYENVGWKTKNLS